MSRKALALLVALGGGAALLCVSRSREAREVSVRPAVASPATGSARAAIEPAVEAPAGEVPEGVPLPAADPPTSERVVLETALENAIWVEGTVRFPSGTPADEEAFVVSDPLGSDASQRVRVQPDGRFRIALPQGTRRARLDLEARYAYLEERLTLDPRRAASPIVLEPLLGGRLEIALVPPSSDAAVLRELRAASILVLSSGIDPSDEAARMPRGEIGNDGIARFGGLSPRHAYDIRIDPTALAAIRLENVRVAAGAVERLERPVERGATIRGRVVDEQGAGVAGATVWCSDMRNLPSFGDRETGADGRFEITGAAPGQNQLVFAQRSGLVTGRHGPLEIVPGQELDGVTLELKRGGVIAGRVRWPDGQPAAGATVRATLEERDGYTHGSTEGSVHADEGGGFELSALEPGLYALEFSAERAALPGSPGLAEERWSARRADVRTGTTSLDLELAPGPTIEGRVVDDTGAPLERFLVHAIPERSAAERAGRPRSARSVKRSFRSPEGAFRLDGLQPGEWRVSARANACSSPEAKVSLPAGEPLVLVVPRPAAVKGRVVDASGAPVSDALVRAGAWSGDGQERTTRAREDGSFSLGDLSPGSTTLSAQVGEPPRKGRLTLHLRAGEVREEVVLELCLLARIEIELWSGIHDRAARMVWLSGEGRNERYVTDGDGRVAIDDLLPGSYRLQLLGSAEKVIARAQMDAGETVHVVLGE